MQQKLLWLLLSFMAYWILACTSEEVYTPKPKGFNRIDLPTQVYQSLPPEYPYSFEYSQHAIIQPDTFANAEPYWIIIYYPELDSRIQLTYKPLYGNLEKLKSHVDDSYTLAAKHHAKATGQKDQVVKFNEDITAVTMELKGEVPSHYQFFTTDTTQHFLRGALYLMEPSLNDSLSPVIEYLKKDCDHLLTTLAWKK